MNKDYATLKQQLTCEFSKSVREKDFRRVAELKELQYNPKNDIKLKQIKSELDSLCNSKTIIESNKIYITYPGTKTKYIDKTVTPGISRSIAFDFFVNLKLESGTKGFDHKDIIRKFNQQSKIHPSQLQTYYQLIYQIEKYGEDTDANQYKDIWEDNDFNIEQLIDYLTWVGIQEDFNYPNGDGRTRCFDLYIEAIAINDPRFQGKTNGIESLLAEAESKNYKIKKFLPEEMYLSKSELNN